MRRAFGVTGVVVALVLVITSCAPYKVLEPKPPLSGNEGTYIPLRKGDDDFELKAGKKYYIEFPTPPENNFYVILNVPAKKKIKSFMTTSLVDGKKPGTPIKDESPFPDTQYVYPVTPAGGLHYWIIDNVPADVTIAVRYRYAPRWRFKFETRYASLKKTFTANKVDRGAYNAIAPGYNLESMDFALALDTIGKHTENLQKVVDELLAIEKLFPAKLLNSRDPAYKNYTELKKGLEEEIAFQNKFCMVLDVFYKEQQTRKNPLEFVNRVDDFITFFNKKADLTPGIVEVGQGLMKRRLAEVGPFYEQRLGSKTDGKPFAADRFAYDNYAKLPQLYTGAGIPQPKPLGPQMRFMGDFQRRALMVQAKRDTLAAIEKDFAKVPQLPADNALDALAKRVEAMGSSVPNPIDEAHGKYQGFACSQKLNELIGALKNDVDKLVEGYRVAKPLLPQLNAFRVQRQYNMMLGSLIQTPQVAFLYPKYEVLDTMSMNEQARLIREDLSKGIWYKSESGLRDLHADQNYLDAKSMVLKDKIVHDLEDTLYIRVERVTRARVMKFLKEKVEQLTDIDSLYEDSAFLPVHEITFSTGSRGELLKRKEQLVADLARMKEYEFPQKAVELLYKKFLESPSDSGVYRARACVAHGKHYQGDDQKTKIRIAECDPTLAKWITKPKKYRRVFALPITTNEKSGHKNQYMVRINVRVKTDAKFPVYDVNVKLPKWLGKTASEEQWYDVMKLNRKVLKNEGRFTIGAPTAKNNYECQITPVQMDKDGNNIFEIRFTTRAFVPIPISMMVQPPIIKKN